MSSKMTAQALQALCAQFPFVRDMSDRDGLTVLTGPVRLRYVNFEKPTSPPSTNKEPRFNCLALVPDFADWRPLEEAAMHAWATSQWAAQTPKNIPWVLQSEKGRGEDGKAKAGFGIDSFGVNGICFNAETKHSVELYDMFADASDPTRPAKMDVRTAYPGMWARLRVRAMAYAMGQNTGVKFWLQMCQRIADDAVLSNFDSASGLSPLAPAGAAPAQMPGAGFGGAPAQAAPPPPASGFGQPAMPAAGGFGGPAAAAAPQAGGWGARR